METSPNRKIIVADFWPPLPEEPDTNLYQDQLGWQPREREEAASSDTEQIWRHFIAPEGHGHVGFDLLFYYVHNHAFYRLDNYNGTLFKTDLRHGGGRYILERCSLNDRQNRHYHIMLFDHPSLVWNSFTICGKGMRYILDNSVLILST